MMACRHTLFESDETSVQTGVLFEPIRFEPIRFVPIRFEPIIDTLERRVAGHACLTSSCTGNYESTSVRSIAIRTAARQSRRGLYFLRLVPSSIDDPGLDMSSTMEEVFEVRMHPGNFVFDIAEPDLVRDPVHSRRIRDYLRRSGFGFALSGVGLGAGDLSFQVIPEFQPEYIKLDPRLTRAAGHPASARVASKLVRLAEPRAACVIAEGVGRPRMLENLWLLGIQFAQGRLFGEPCGGLSSKSGGGLGAPT